MIVLIGVTFCFAIGVFIGLHIGRHRAIATVDHKPDTHIADLQAALARAEQADLAKNEFLANTCHDIRTPLTAVLGYTDLLQDELCAGSKAQQWSEIIRRNSQHLLGLLDDILDLSKIEARKMTVEAIDCSLLRLLGDVRSLLTVRADAKKLSLKFEFVGQVPEQVKTDPTRVRQILINLVSNAIKFTHAGGVTVRCALDTAGAEPHMRIDIIDTGVGMTAEQQQRIFSPYTQGDTGHARQFGGTGLGLTISKQLATLLGGDVSVHSDAGHGSTFTFTFSTGPLEGVLKIEPKSFEPQSAPPIAAAPPRAMAVDSLAGLRVLLADDGADNRRMIELLLTRAGATVRSVEDGVAAVAAALSETPGDVIDVLLLDMQMPLLDGCAAARQLRNAGFTKPIIALTAHALLGERERCLAAGCDDFATKPINRRLLLAMLAKWSPNRLSGEGCSESGVAA